VIETGIVGAALLRRSSGISGASAPDTGSEALALMLIRSPRASGRLPGD
jgi:hypothetical protein